MGSAASPLIIVVMVFAAAVSVAAMAWWVFSSLASAPGGATHRMSCGFRQGSHAPWSVGTSSYEQDRLVHRSVGVSLTSGHVWDRSRLHVSLGRDIDGAEVTGRLRGRAMVCVPCRFDDVDFQLAVTSGAYTALRSWVEAVPPGWNANVA